MPEAFPAVSWVQPEAPNQPPTPSWVTELSLESPTVPKSKNPRVLCSVPHSLSESHVGSVQQELLPPVGAHQGHCLLIQPNLCHTAMVREARLTGLTGLLTQGKVQWSLCCPCKDMGTHRGGTARGITASSPSLKGSLPMDTNPPSPLGR